MASRCGAWSYVGKSVLKIGLLFLGLGVGAVASFGAAKLGRDLAMDANTTAARKAEQDPEEVL